MWRTGDVTPWWAGKSQLEQLCCRWLSYFSYYADRETGSCASCQWHQRAIGPGLFVSIMALTDDLLIWHLVLLGCIMSPPPLGVHRATIRPAKWSWGKRRWGSDHLLVERHRECLRLVHDALERKHRGQSRMAHSCEAERAWAKSSLSDVRRTVFMTSLRLPRLWLLGLLCKCMFIRIHAQ